MKWYKIDLTLEEIAQGTLLYIHNQFSTLCLKSGTPKEAAMFAGGLDEEGEILYFSPASVVFMKDIIQQYKGEETERPDISRLTLLVGYSDVRSRLFE